MRTPMHSYDTNLGSYSPINEISPNQILRYLPISRYLSLYKDIPQYIPWNMHMVLLCFVLLGYITILSGFMCLIYSYSSGLLHWHWGNHTIAPVPVKQPWRIWVNWCIPNHNEIRLFTNCAHNFWDILISCIPFHASHFSVQLSSSPYNTVSTVTATYWWLTAVSNSSQHWRYLSTKPSIPPCTTCLLGGNCTYKRPWTDKIDNLIFTYENMIDHAFFLHAIYNGCTFHQLHHFAITSIT